MGMGESTTGKLPHCPASEVEARASSLPPGEEAVAASPPPPALPHSTPDQVRELMEAREGTERSPQPPGSSPASGLGAAQLPACVLLLLAWRFIVKSRVEAAASLGEGRMLWCLSG